MTDAGLRSAALAVVAYWDGLWEVVSDDPRPTEDFRDELERRIGVLRESLEGRGVSDGGHWSPRPWLDQIYAQYSTPVLAPDPYQSIVAARLAELYRLMSAHPEYGYGVALTADQVGEWLARNGVTVDVG